MKRVPAPPRFMVLTDMNGDTTLRITDSNQGEPFRRTLVLTFESGAHGDFKRYEHLGSVELEGHEEAQLRDFLNARAGQ